MILGNCIFYLKREYTLKRRRVRFSSQYSIGASDVAHAKPSKAPTLITYPQFRDSPDTDLLQQCFAILPDGTCEPLRKDIGTGLEHRRNCTGDSEITSLGY